MSASAGRALLAVVAVCACVSTPSQQSLTPTPSTPGNAIVIENARPGDDGWKLTVNNRITGYPDATSVDVGGTIRFAISTTSRSFNVAVYRLGWYGGQGGRRMHYATGISGTDQGHWVAKEFGVQNCPTCEVNTSTGLVDAHWASSYSLTVPPSWTSGVYLVRLSTSNGDTGSIPFVVRDDFRATAVLAVLAVNTWQAYNPWGGKSLYASSSYGEPTIGHDARAVKVSFNRPYASQEPPTGDLNLISFLERSSYDVSYATDVDIDRSPQLVSEHAVLVAMGHSEYWTAKMRKAVETGRDEGDSLAFIGGNDVYWQARYESDTDGGPERILVVYKSAALDPITSINPREATALWEDPPVSSAQNALTGTLFVGGFPSVPEPWTVGMNAPSWALAGTGLLSGDMIPNVEVGECDRAASNSESPPSLVLLGSSHFIATTGRNVECDSTLYRTNSGGSEVFSAGDIGWTDLLGGSTANTSIIRLTENILTRMVSRGQTAVA